MQNRSAFHWRSINIVGDVGWLYGCGPVKFSIRSARLSIFILYFAVCEVTYIVQHYHTLIICVLCRNAEKVQGSINHADGSFEIVVQGFHITLFL